MQNIKHKLRYMFLFLPVFLILICTLTGCQSTDKSQSFLDSSGLSYSQFEYDSTNNKTKVIWATTLTNDTIYNFDSFSVEFKLYNNSTLIGTKTYNYDRGVKHGSDYTGKFNFYADGEVTSIEYVAWNANYYSFWDTYKIWFIVTIVVAVILAIAYIIVMIIGDLELGDVGEFIADHWWIAFSLLLPLGGSLYGIITSAWVPVLIIIGGIVAVILIGLIAHLIKFIVEEAGFGGFGRDKYIGDSEDENGDYYDDEEDEYEDENYDEIVKKTRKKLNNKSVSKIKRISFDDIAGLEIAKKAFKEKVVYAFEHKELYEKYGKKVGGGLLLYGLPGTGKTMFAEAASNETDAIFIPIKCSDIKSKWYGESENNVKKIFEKARKAKRAIIFFDEFEAIGAKRTDNSDNGNNDLVPQILAEMQGIGSVKSDNIIMVIAATNKPWAIDSAFLRPGRFDEKIYIPLPDFEARKKLFELKLKSIPQQDLNFEYLAEISNGFNGADIGEFCDKLKMLAINRSIATNEESPITMEDVSEIKEKVKSSVSKEDIERLEEFMKN